MAACATCATWAAPASSFQQQRPAQRQPAVARSAARRNGPARAAAGGNEAAAAPPVDPFAEKTQYKDNFIDKVCGCTER